MMSRPRSLGGAVLVALAMSASPRAQQAPPVRNPGAVERCAMLTTLRLPDVRLTEVQYTPADAAARGPVHVGHCRATGAIGAEIGFTVWLPDDWNERFLMFGGGRGHSRPGRAVERGFVVTSTDTGHKAEVDVTAKRALEIFERQSTTRIWPRIAPRKPRSSSCHTQPRSASRLLRGLLDRRAAGADGGAAVPADSTASSGAPVYD